MKDKFQILLSFMHILLIEISSRQLGAFNRLSDIQMRDININEVMNETFTVSENLRNELKKLVTSLSLDEFSDTSIPKNNLCRSLEQATGKLLYSILVFQNKWATSYQQWFSHFKSLKDNRSLLSSGEELIFLNYQTLFPYSRELMSDLHSLLEEIHLFRVNVQDTEEKLQRILLIESKSWMWRLFNRDIVNKLNGDV